MRVSSVFAAEVRMFNWSPVRLARASAQAMSRCSPGPGCQTKIANAALLTPG